MLKRTISWLGMSYSVSFFLMWERDVLSVHLNMCSCVWHVLLIFQLDTTMATKIATLVLRLFYIDCNRARVQVRQWSIIILCIKIKTIDSHSVQYDRQSRGMANVTKFVAYRIRIVRSNMHKINFHCVRYNTHGFASPQILVRHSEQFSNPGIK